MKNVYTQAGKKETLQLTARNEGCFSESSRKHFKTVSTSSHLPREHSNRSNPGEWAWHSGTWGPTNTSEVTRWRAVERRESATEKEGERTSSRISTIFPPSLIRLPLCQATATPTRCRTWSRFRDSGTDSGHAFHSLTSPFRQDWKRIRVNERCLKNQISHDQNNKL